MTLELPHLSSRNDPDLGRQEAIVQAVRSIVSRGRPRDENALSAIFPLPRSQCCNQRIGKHFPARKGQITWLIRRTRTTRERTLTEARRLQLQTWHLGEMERLSPTRRSSTKTRPLPCSGQRTILVRAMPPLLPISWLLLGYQKAVQVQTIRTIQFCSTALPTAIRKTTWNSRWPRVRLAP